MERDRARKAFASAAAELECRQRPAAWRGWSSLSSSTGQGGPIALPYISSIAASGAPERSVTVAAIVGVTLASDQPKELRSALLASRVFVEAGVVVSSLWLLIGPVEADTALALALRIACSPWPTPPTPLLPLPTSPPVVVVVVVVLFPGGTRRQSAVGAAWAATFCSAGLVSCVHE